MELLTDPQAWIAFATLTMLELVLGIDNIIFISILVDRLPSWKASRAGTPPVRARALLPCSGRSW